VHFIQSERSEFNSETRCFSKFRCEFVQKMAVAKVCCLTYYQKH